MTKPLAACPNCGHDWDRHTGSCHYIGDCSGRECGCQRKPLAAPLSQSELAEQKVKSVYSDARFCPSYLDRGMIISGTPGDYKYLGDNWGETNEAAAWIKAASMLAEVAAPLPESICEGDVMCEHKRCWDASRARVRENINKSRQEYLAARNLPPLPEPIEKCKSCFKMVSATSKAGLCKECVDVLNNFKRDVRESGEPMLPTHPYAAALLEKVSVLIKRAWLDASSESQSDLDEAQGMVKCLIPLFLRPDASVSPLPEIASDPICECDCVHCRAGNHRLCCKAAQCTPSPVPLPEIASPDEFEDNECHHCFATISVREGCDPTKYCDNCAQEIAAAASPVPLGEPTKMKMVEVHHVSKSEAHERAIALIQKLRPLGCFADEDGIWGELDFLMICLKPTPTPVPLGEPAQTFEEWKNLHWYNINWLSGEIRPLIKMSDVEDAWNASLATKAVPIGEGERLLKMREIVKRTFPKHNYGPDVTLQLIDSLLQLLQRERAGEAEIERLTDGWCKETLRRVELEAELSRLRSQERPAQKSDLERIQGSYSSGEQPYTPPKGSRERPR